MQHRCTKCVITEHRVASCAGVLSAWVITPGVPSRQPPLAVLHGISRNAAELVDLFLPEAERNCRTIIVPHFPASEWPVFQRPTRSARPDHALLALLSHLSAWQAAFRGPVDLFGHSGGAQLAHRFAMLYPQRVARLNLAAAGWYCLPDAGMAHPYGIGADQAPGALAWARRHNHALPDYLRRPVRVFVGTRDTDRDSSLRQSKALDHIQGSTRVARAETYVDRFRAAALGRGIVPDIRLIRLQGVTHDVAQAIRFAGLARLVATPETDCPALSA